MTPTNAPVLKILMCLETLVDLVLRPGWTNDYDDLDQRTADIDELRDLLESDKVLLYVPPILVSAIHMTVSLSYGLQQACQVVQEILRISNSSITLDYDRVLDQTNAMLLSASGEMEFYEGVLLACASALSADYVVARHPHQLNRLRERCSELRSLEASMVTVKGLIGLLKERGVHQPQDDANVLVLTPEARVIRLPKGSTPIDFAYKIHSRLGDRCETAFVDNAEVSLDTPLRMGNVVRIEKGDRPAPEEEWLTFARTKAARHGIRRGLKRYWCAQGWAMLQETLGNNVRAYRQKLEGVAAHLGQPTNELVSKIGSGEMDIAALQALIDAQVGENTLQTGDRTDKSRTWRLASCCSPLPGDDIVGVTAGSYTIRVHRADCPNLIKVNPEKLQRVSWMCRSCRLQLSLMMSDQPDVLRPILNQLVEDYNIEPDLRNVSSASDGTMWVSLGITVNSRKHLNKIVQKIEDTPQVIRTKVAKLAPTGCK
ncbi:MAG: TGS domain-containing protein [Cyanobacteria bacterium P01_A01_bin.135]